MAPGSFFLTIVCSLNAQLKVLPALFGWLRKKIHTVSGGKGGGESGKNESACRWMDWLMMSS